MNWLDKYKPILLKNIKHNSIEVNKAIKWIESYKKDSYNTKKVLLIIGTSGIGKTLIADLLFNNYTYQKIELNSSDVRSQKKIGEFLKKSLTYKNVVDMFNEGNTPIGILLDEIDTICKLSDKGGFTEFLSIVKQNDKCQTLKKNIAEKKKVKKTKISIDDYVKLYNPIICTSNDINDKKLTELKKYSEVIYLQKPNKSEINDIINEIYGEISQKITDDAKNILYEYSQGDVRRLIMLLEDLYYFSKESEIDEALLNNYKKIFKEKKEDIQLLNSTKLLITKKLSIKESSTYFDIDCLLTPLMIYHNSINYIKNTENNNNEKLNVYKNVLESLCIHDTIQTNIFEVQDWFELYDIASIYGSTIPNYNFNLLKSKKDIDIEFTSLLNKISQMFVNKKLLNSAKFSIGKLNYDTDEIIYLTEILSNYFDNYKNNQKNCDNDDNDDNDDIDEDFLDNENNIFKKPLENNSKLINFMNTYKIGIESFENILKIEKLNQINEKRKKKFTLKIKKELTNFLSTKDNDIIIQKLDEAKDSFAS